MLEPFRTPQTHFPFPLKELDDHFSNFSFQLKVGPFFFLSRGFLDETKRLLFKLFGLFENSQMTRFTFKSFLFGKKRPFEVGVGPIDSFSWKVIF